MPKSKKRRKVHTQYETLYDSLNSRDSQTGKTKIQKKALKVLETRDILVQRTILGLILTHAIREGLDVHTKLPYGIKREGKGVVIDSERLDRSLLKVIGSLPIARKKSG